MSISGDDAGESASDRRSSSLEQQSGVQSTPRRAVETADDQDNHGKVDWNGLSGQPASESKSSSKDDIAPSTHHESDSDEGRFRAIVGGGSVQMSELINSNLIVARYAAFAGIGLLTAYGLSHSPIFSRFKTVSDIPSQYFLQRKKLHCRLVDALDVGSAGASSSPSSALLASDESGPIRLRVRHLSLFERYCVVRPKWFEAWMKLHPSACRPDQNPNELLTVILAGVHAPPVLDSFGTEATSPIKYLQRWARSRPVLTVQLLARRKFLRHDIDDHDAFASTAPGGASAQSRQRKKRRIPSHLVTDATTLPQLVGRPTAYREETDDGAVQAAVVRATYRAQATQILPTDLARFLVQTGRATASGDEGLYLQQRPPNREDRGQLPSAMTSDFSEGVEGATTSVIVDADRSVPTLQDDARYLSLLTSAEYEAARRFEGVWSDPEFRRRHPDVVEEAEFQANAPWWKKLWRWGRGG